GRARDTASRSIVTPSLAYSGTRRPVRRSFPPGSEWLYVKLYTGPATVDHALRDVVKPVLDELIRAAAADRWFFIRYGDPDWHLRLRVHGDPARLHDEVLPLLQSTAAPLLENGRLWRIQLDTYKREVERYGGPDGILLAEQVFHADSEAVLQLAGVLSEDARGDVRWRLVLLGMHLLLTDLGLDLETRHAVMRRMRNAYATQCQADENLRHSLSTRFRSERKGLEALLNRAPSSDALLALGQAALRGRSERLAAIVSQLRHAAR